MIRGSLYTPRPFTGIPAGILMLLGVAWNSEAFSDFEGGNYQPKRRDKERTEQQI